MTRQAPLWFIASLGFALLLGMRPTRAAKELQRSTWEIPEHEQVQAEIETWLAEAGVDPRLQDKIRLAWQEPVPASRRLSLLAESFAQVHDAARQLVRFCETMKAQPEVPEFAVLSDSETLPFERHHLQLIFARWLAHNQLYDETLEEIGDLEPKDVVDPATLLFYQSVAYHRLLRKQECLPVVQRLLEKEEALPRRFARMAYLIQADIEPLQADSLDEISRLMDSIRVRLGHGRAGTRVRKEEDDVIAKLDKMIKQLEDQAQQQAAAAQASGTPGQNLQPATPMQDSLPGGGTGPGNVDPKDVGSKSGWGDLPPKERQQALQELGDEFPSHYRDVIEEFFRKLAKDGAER